LLFRQTPQDIVGIPATTTFILKNGTTSQTAPITSFGSSLCSNAVVNVQIAIDSDGAGTISSVSIDVTVDDVQGDVQISSVALFLTVFSNIN
jgi:hypothetical protein